MDPYAQALYDDPNRKQRRLIAIIIASLLALVAILALIAITSNKAGATTYLSTVYSRQKMLVGVLEDNLSKITDTPTKNNSATTITVLTSLNNELEANGIAFSQDYASPAETINQDLNNAALNNQLDDKLTEIVDAELGKNQQLLETALQDSRLKPKLKNTIDNILENYKILLD